MLLILLKFQTDYFIEEKMMETLKQQFKQWLEKQQHSMLVPAEFDDMLNKLDENLNVISGNRFDRELLTGLVKHFRLEKDGKSPAVISASVNEFINLLF